MSQSISENDLLTTRILRDQAEAAKFTAEREKLSAEREKLAAEREKMFMEALKLERDRSLSVWQTIVAAFAAGAGVLGASLALAKFLIG